jgi:hypothetical protein
MIVVLVCVFAAITGALAALRVLDRSDGLASSIAAGVCYAWLSFSGALLGEAFSRGSSLLIALWGLGTVTAALLAVTAEMSALQAWPVSRSKPVVFVLQTLIPASAAPFFSAHRLGPGRGAAFVLALAIVTGGAVVIATSRAVAETQA